ncbi:MAG: hypothetical protein J4F36_14215 [Nitrosopumilaceae archaeon]|nr:hypothetical protein [Nitrosopumilaceae archaeon]
MTWKLLEIGYNFYFQYECLDGMERHHVKKTLDTIRELDDPLSYERLITSCPQHERLIVNAIDSKLLIGLIVHNDDDPKFQHCLELVKIFNPSELGL